MINAACISDHQKKNNGEYQQHKPYNPYEIASPVDVFEGTAIPWFDEKGMGNQYELADK